MHDTKPNNWIDSEWIDYKQKLKNIGYKKKAHWNAYYHCSIRDRLINLPIILISSLLSTTAVSQISTNDNTYLPYLITLASLLVTGLTTFSRYYNFGELKESHRLTSLNYYRLRSELIMLVETRSDENVSKYKYQDFLREYYGKIKGIRENAPLLPNKIYQILKMKKEKKNDNIEIVIEEEN